MLLDSSVPEQGYLEDCEVCCRPIAIRYQFQEGGRLERFQAQPS